jgi:hypothetical protein
MRGRRYRVRIEITYAGGRLPDEAREALASAIWARAGRGSSDGAMTVSADPHSIVAVGATVIVAVGATVRADNPREALSQLDEALDDALMATGLFEEFDVTGKILRVAPLDRAY